MPARMNLAMLVVLLTPILGFTQDLDSQLIEAAENGQTEKVQALLEAGAEVNAKDEEGATPLARAVLGNFPGIVNTLLKAGAEINELILAAAKMKGDTEVMQLLSIDSEGHQLWERYNSTGLQSYREGRYADAEKSWLAALGEAEMFGDRDIRLATSLGSLGTLYLSQGKYAEAEPMYQRALGIWNTMGSENPLMAMNLNGLAVVYHSQGKHAEAEPLYQAVLEILERTLPPSEDPSTRAQVIENYAALLRELDRTAEAEKLEERARAIRGEAQ